MANPSCIVESGKLSPVGQRNLDLFHAQDAKRILIVLMSDAHRLAGYFGPDPSAAGPTAWILAFAEAGIPVTASTKMMRSGTRAAIVLTAGEWATRRNVGRYRDDVFQVWGDGGDARRWPVSTSAASGLELGALRSGARSKA